jgi:hypothetical protein
MDEVGGIPKTRYISLSSIWNSAGSVVSALNCTLVVNLGEGCVCSRERSSSDIAK